MRAIIATALVASACRFRPAGGQAAPDSGATDAAGRPDGCATFSTLLDTCALAAGGSEVAITGPADYDTATNTLTMGGGSPSHPRHVLVTTPEGTTDVLIASAFALTGKLRVHGQNTFGIAAEQGIALDGTIDLTDAGAGARSDAACAELVGLPARSAGNHGGGGGGGAFFGGGGRGMDFTTGGATGGAAGSSSGMARVGLQGGCDGGKGGDGTVTGSGGAGGDGGGAILLATAATLTLTSNGAINTGGGGGHSGNKNGGGGGGGSAGMIVIEASVLANAGAIAANGGGGGEGGDASLEGMRGQGGQASLARALGGANGSALGGAGAFGGAAMTPAGADANVTVAAGGGGGGGGGAGFVAIGRATPNGIISPPPVAWP